LSPDEKVLYVANGRTIAAFDVQPDGSLRNFRTHATLVGLNRNAQGQVQGGADSICMDSAGRIYAATSVGVQVFSPQGQHLGTIPIPLPPQAPAFAGPDKKTLYVVGRGAVYKIAMLAQGVQGRAK
jgi:gluconolactonase